MRVAFFGFCALTVLFLSYLFERQSTFQKLKEQLLAELERNVALQIQASADLLKSMPDRNFFWDRLSMEFRRAQTVEKMLSLIVVKVNRNRKAGSDPNAALSAAVKAMSRKLRPGDSVYRLAEDMFGVVLPETDTLNAKRVAVRLQEELQGVRAHFNCTFDLTAHNYPEHVKSAHELEDIVKSMFPDEAPLPDAVPVG